MFAAVRLCMALLVLCSCYRHDSLSLSATGFAPVHFATQTPTFDWESIRNAIVAYDINVPSSVSEVTLNSELLDRGRTIYSPNAEKLLVTIGPSAFESWAMLGSTLAHELEIHAKQNLGMISVMRNLGLPAVDWAEIQAYRHELENAQRFNLSGEEIARIQSNLARYQR